MSGHNKWSKIKRAKGAADAKRSKQYSKILKEVAVAVRESGPDPDSNPRLRLLVQNARGCNMRFRRLLSSAMPTTALPCLSSVCRTTTCVLWLISAAS